MCSCRVCVQGFLRSDLIDECKAGRLLCVQRSDARLACICAAGGVEGACAEDNLCYKTRLVLTVLTRSREAL